MLGEIIRSFFSSLPIVKLHVHGGSMYPTLQEGDTVLVNRLSYRFSPPKIGNIVVARYKSSYKAKEKYIVKRVKKTKNDLFFLEGDNRGESTDSKHFGWVKKKDIIGKVIYNGTTHSFDALCL